jgi:hypothetical protein
MKKIFQTILILSCFFILPLSNAVSSTYERISARAPTKHEALTKVHSLLPSNSKIIQIYYSGSANNYFCFVKFERVKNTGKSGN